MILHDLQENTLAKVQTALTETFGVDIDFNASKEKLIKMQAATDSRINKLRESGCEQTTKSYQKLLLINEGLKHAVINATNYHTQEETVKVSESADLDQAEVLLAAKQMADDLQKMAENLASMQVEDLMSITNAMKEEVGTAEAEAFNVAAEAAIGGALDAVKAANEGVSNAVLAAQGQEIPSDMDDMDMGIDTTPDLDMDVDVGDEEPEADDFEGADAADSSFDDTGREMKEDAYLAAMRIVKEAQSEGKVSTTILKQAFAHLKK
jgi:hypothetical protein